MAIASGDAVRKYSATTITCEANGASCANGAIIDANDATYDLTATDHADAPDLLVVFTGAWATAPNASGPLILVIQALDVSGTDDEPDPTASYIPRRSATIYVKDLGSSTTQRAEVYARDVPRKGKLWWLNKTGQTLGSGWTTTVTPCTKGPKP